MISQAKPMCEINCLNGIIYHRLIRKYGDIHIYYYVLQTTHFNISISPLF